MSFLHKNYSSLNDADIEDIVQDSSCLLWQNIENDKYEKREAALSTYYLSICKNQANNRCRAHRTIIDPLENVLELSMYKDENVEYLLEMSSSRNQILDAMEGIVKSFPKPCNSILWNFYWANFSMEEIANFEGYKNADVAKSKKSKCLSKFKNHINTICKQNRWTLTD